MRGGIGRMKQREGAVVGYEEQSIESTGCEDRGGGSTDERAGGGESGGG